jgi:hypothetical protein
MVLVELLLTELRQGRSCIQLNGKRSGWFMFRVKRFVMTGLVLVALASVADAAGEDKMYKILTSQPNHSTMVLAANDSFAAGIPMVDSKTHKFKGFAVAYKDFDSACQKYIRAKCDKDHLKGVVNYKISYVISDKMYYFSAQFDYFKNNLA